MPTRAEIGEYWGDSFLEELIKQCDKTQYKKSQDTFRKRDKALVAVLFLTGGYVEDVLTLKKSNIDLEDEEAKEMNAFVIRNMIVSRYIFKKGKPRPVPRTFPIFYGDPLVEHFLGWLPEVDDYLFPSKSKNRMHLGRGRAWQIITNLGKRLKVHVSPRKLRDQRMSHLALSGFSPNDIQGYLKLVHPPAVAGHREAWRNLLYVTRKPKQEVIMAKGLNPNELKKLANKKPSIFFPASIWKRMTGIERSDFSDAANCLLAGTATPSVMVALRGSEASIMNFYETVTGTDSGKRTWRNITKELKNKADVLGIKDTFVGYLDYYGEAKRNFAQHPNKVFSMEEAVTIFMQVVGLVADVYAQI